MRQTRLARDFVKERVPSLFREVTYFDLERDSDLAKLEPKMLALESLKGLVVIDEVQRLPRLFEALRVLVDRRPLPARFLILGSASRDLIRQSSETLAGRISYLELTPFQGTEISPTLLSKLWFRGGFPRSFLAADAGSSIEWRQEYTATYLERDLPSLGIQIPAATLRRFWMMLAHYHGQIFNASEIGGAMGLSHHTVQRYLDILSGTFMVRVLQPWHENVGKRQVKAPKIFFRDSGILHALLGIPSEKDLRLHPKVGASWEGFAIEEVIRAAHVRSEDCFFWATHNQAELDLFVLKDGRRLGFEVKYTDAPRITRSMRIALEDLKLDQLTIVFPGKDRFSIEKRVEAVGLQALIAQENHRRLAGLGGTEPLLRAIPRLHQ